MRIRGADAGLSRRSPPFGFKEANEATRTTRDVEVSCVILLRMGGRRS